MKDYQRKFLEKAKELKNRSVAMVVLGRRLKKKNVYLVVQGREYPIDVLRCRDTRDVERLTQKVRKKKSLK